MAQSTVRTIDSSDALGRIVLQLVAARRRDGRTTLPVLFREDELARFRLLPPWVARAALLRSRGAWWLWCEPRRGSRAAGGQFVMDVPAGRYMIDVLDVRTHAWFSRESAAATPLVAGLPATGHPVLAKIRRVSPLAPRPRE